MTVADHRLTLRAGWGADGRPCRLLARPGGPAGLKLLIVRAPLEPAAAGAEESDPSTASTVWQRP